MKTSAPTGCSGTASSGASKSSEASRRIPEDLLDKHPEIPWHKVKAIGNVLRHECHDIVDEVIWRIVEDDLGPLKLAVSRMLQEAGGG
jgi:uncharacterized protein with HEPN domain